jgi:hypothetical protein
MIDFCYRRWFHPTQKKEEQLPSSRREETKIAPDGVRRGGRNPGTASESIFSRPVGPRRTSSFLLHHIHAIALASQQRLRNECEQSIKVGLL